MRKLSRHRGLRGDAGGGTRGSRGLSVVVVALTVALLSLVSQAGWTENDTVEAAAATTDSTEPDVRTSTVDTAASSVSPDAAQTVTSGSEPILGVDAPDPFVLVTSEGPIVFTTNTVAGNVPVLAASHAARGEELQFEDALPLLPAWAVAGYTWAPAVISVGGTYVLAFSAMDAASGRQCIGVATAAAATGPYSPLEVPLVCGVDEGGAIDPSFVVDADGFVRLVYKVDGNCCGLPTSIETVALDESATSVVEEPTTLLVADQEWEGGVIEAPSMVAVGDRWLLLYSANDWNDAAYAVGAAWCDTPTGPCVKLADPVLASREGLDGPGGLEIISDSVATGELLVAFHAWPEGRVGYDEGSARALHLGRVIIEDDRVTVEPIARSRN